MRIIYCSKREDIDYLKKNTESYKSSQIKTLSTATLPLYNREFLSIDRIEYADIDEIPQFERLWNDLMSSKPLKFSFEYLDSQKIFDDYVKFNKDFAERIKAGPNDLVIVNDPALYLLPSLISSDVAIRNIRFHGAYMERIPFYRLVIESLFKAKKFFQTEDDLKYFNEFVDSSIEFIGMEKGGSWYLSSYVEKEAVEDILSGVLTCLKSENKKFSTADINKIYAILEEMHLPKKKMVILTDAPLLHIEAYIKKYPNTSIRYLRRDSDFNEEQSKMMLYLKKVYGCSITVIDTPGNESLVIEMLFCDIYVGFKYEELARLLRKPTVLDGFDSEELKLNIEKRIGKIHNREKVKGEDEYIKEFMYHCGYDIIEEDDLVIDDKIDSYVLELLSWNNTMPDSTTSLCNLSLKESTSYNKSLSQSIASLESMCEESENTIYYKRKDGKSGLYRKISKRSLSNPITGIASKTNEIISSIDQQVKKKCDCFTADSECKQCNCKNSITENSTSSIAKDGLATVSHSDKSNSTLMVKNVAENKSTENVDGKNALENKSALNTSSDDKKVDSSKKESKITSVTRNKTISNSKDGELDSSTVENKPVKESLEKLDLLKLKDFWERSNKIALFDYDGTLAHIEDRPELAKPKPELIAFIRHFNRKGRLIICTGRQKNVVDEWFPSDIEVYAEHGGCHRKNGDWSCVSKIDRLDECIEIMEYYSRRTPGSILEVKECGCCFHYKLVENFDIDKMYKLLRQTVGDAVVLGKGVIEVKSYSKDKVCKAINPAICAGDDMTDEDMFNVCTGISIRVENGPSKADYYVSSVDEFLDVLRELIKD